MVILENFVAILSIMLKAESSFVKTKKGKSPGNTAFANSIKPRVMLEVYLAGLAISKMMAPKIKKEIK